MPLQTHIQKNLTVGFWQLLVGSLPSSHTRLDSSSPTGLIFHLQDPAVTSIIPAISWLLQDLGQRTKKRRTPEPDCGVGSEELPGKDSWNTPCMRGFCPRQGGHPSQPSGEHIPTSASKTVHVAGLQTGVCPYSN